MSAKELAALCGISVPRLRRRLSGAVPFYIKEISDVLDVLCAGKPSELIKCAEARLGAAGGAA